MKFMDSGNSETESGDTPIMTTNNGVDLMKSEKGFENVVGSETTSVVEPTAETITNPEQLNIKEESAPVIEEPVKSDLFNTVVDNDPMGLSANKEEETPIVEPSMPTNEVNTLTSEVKKSEEPVSTSNDQLPFMEPKKKGVSGILVTLLIIMAFVAAGCVYYFVLLTPEKILTKSFSKLYEKSNLVVDKCEENINFSSIHLKGNAKLESEIEELEMFNGYNIDYDFGYDKTNEKMNIDLGLSANSEKLLSAAFFYKESIGYLNVEGITPRMLKFDLSEFSEYLDVEEDSKLDVKYLVGVIGKALQENISMNKVTRKISYGDPIEKKLGVVLTYDVDSVEYRKVVTAIVDAINADEKALEMLIPLFECETAEEVKEALTETLQYTDFNIEDTKVTLMLDIFSNELLYFGVKSSELEMSAKEDAGVFKFNAAILGEDAESISLEYNIANKEMKLDSSVLEDGTTSTIGVNVKSTNKNEKSVDNTITIKVTPDTTKQEENMMVTIEETIELDTKVEDEDVSKAVFFEDLTEEESTQLSETLSSLLGLFEEGEPEM